MTQRFTPPEVKGWCPGLFAPMQAKDGWLVRVRPAFGRITAAQAVFLAQIAEREGNGLICLTNRASLQLRGFSHANALRFPELAVLAGLGMANPEHEKRLALLASPLAGCDPSCAPDTLECTTALRAALCHANILSALPDKFGFAVDGGGVFNVGLLKADIMLQGTGAGFWSVVCGNQKSKPASVQAAVELAIKLAQAFITIPKSKRPARYPETGKMLFQAVNELGDPVEVPAADAPDSALLAGKIGQALYALNAPLGILTSAMLRSCANHARNGDGILRLTPWHSIILHGLSYPPHVAGMVDTSTNPILRVSACMGNAGCAQAEGETQALAKKLAHGLKAEESLHVSGCSKGCAHPAKASWTVVAAQNGYGLICNGTASGPVMRFFPDDRAVEDYFIGTKPQERIMNGRV
ncbi:MULTISPECIES: precorrin-3B synthase [Acetobacter]|uniref:Precorrin-3B synthase n=1 Tax=Acetobacter pasteurianus subsp. pasteurianus TaxID=481145 RepID=A0A1Y0Y0U1_ACEPA|nr:precorrin-3B synthase [Acetobacter pasteurianus]AKR50006.1 cobalamin biosynthesis protein CobG [Acetobacter pasteurianus]ARW48813.1 Precorrin-3B synthase [Acetobacter pasteurianus subsp. pasteurianus]